MATFLALSLRFTDYVFLLPQVSFAPYLHLRPGLGLVSSALLIFVVWRETGRELGFRSGERTSAEDEESAYTPTRAAGTTAIPSDRR